MGWNQSDDMLNSLLANGVYLHKLQEKQYQVKYLQIVWRQAPIERLAVGAAENKPETQPN